MLFIILELLFICLFSESMDDIAEYIKCTIAFVSNAVKISKKALESVMNAKMLTNELIRDKTFVAPTAGKRFAQADIPETVTSEPKRRRTRVQKPSAKEQEETDRNIAVTITDQAMPVKIPPKGTFLGYAFRNEPNKRCCTICRDTCKSKKGSVKKLDSPKILHEHISNLHNLYVCSCMKWCHYKDGTKSCHLKCKRKHLRNSKQDHPIVFNNKTKKSRPCELTRDFCATRAPNMQITVIDHNHKAQTYVDSVPCLCKQCQKR